jgi:Zn finger protein HypA/HybF involved in hydrogenase expression
MHEIGIVQDLIKSIQKETSSRQDITRIEKVYIRLGKASEFTEDSLKFWFDNLSKGTELQGVDLDISLIDGNKVFLDGLEVSDPEKGAV